MCAKLILIAGLTLVVAGCSGGENGDSDKKADDGADAGGPIFQPTDTLAGDDATGTGTDGGKTTGPDAVSVNDAEGGGGFAFQAACSSNDECDSGRCVFTADGLQCSKSCADDCGADSWTCQKVGTESYCVWKWGHVCEPCTANKDCFSHGQTTAKCVDFGGEGGFCGVSCASDTQCPSGYKCNNGKDVQGKDAQQCVPITGGCLCSAWSVGKKLTTTCQQVSTFGSCPGFKTCEKTGDPAPCDAPTPATEACDTKDNDCDGETDEGTCEDNEFCTTTTCNGDKGCTSVNKVGGCDADGSACTAADNCVDGKCKAGEALICDDKNPCTQDVCDASKGCVFSNAAAPCNADDNPCTVADVCKEGKCTAGGAKPCEAGQPCTKGACSITDGKCNFVDKDGHSCEDGDACSTTGKCLKDICKANALDCDDGEPCTTDGCDSKVGCLHAATKGSCDDGNACTKSDNCSGAKCVGLPISASEDCDDGNPCTTDGCDPKKAANPTQPKELGCTHAPAAGPCDDGNACTVKDACDGSKCVGGSNECTCKTDLDCDNSNSCTEDTCVAAAGKQVCKSTPIDKLACDADGDTCTQDDLCTNGKCVAGAAKNCDDANQCTADSCDPKTGCKNAVKSSSCDDGNPCTTGDVCLFIGGGKATCKGGKDKDCDDSVGCTVDSCDPKSGGCKNVSAIGKAAPCYSGDTAKVGIGPCKKGSQTCKADGTLGACIGEVVAKLVDVCGNAVDDDCNGVTDQGCSPAEFDGRMVSGAVSGKSGNLQAGGVFGGALANGTHKAGKWTIGLGLYEWLGTL